MLEGLDYRGGNFRGKFALQFFSDFVAAIFSATDQPLGVGQGEREVGVHFLLTRNHGEEVAHTFFGGAFAARVQGIFSSGEHGAKHAFGSRGNHAEVRDAFDDEAMRKSTRVQHAEFDFSGGDFALTEVEAPFVEVGADFFWSRIFIVFDFGSGFWGDSRSRRRIDGFFFVRCYRFGGCGWCGSGRDFLGSG